MRQIAEAVCHTVGKSLPIVGDAGAAAVVGLPASCAAWGGLCASLGDAS